MSENVKGIDNLFDEEFGDLLEDAKEEKPVKEVAPKKEEVAQTADLGDVAPAKAPVVEENYISFGARFNAEPIPRFKASKDNKARVSIISKNVLPMKFHYVDGIGSFACFDGKCCELEGFPKVRYVMPIVVYDTDKTGRIISDKLELRALSIGSDLYDALADAIGMSGRDVTQCEVLISCSDEKYQKLTFAVDNRVPDASWKKSSSAKEIVEKYKANKAKLGLSVARTISPEVYLTRKGFLKKAETEAPGPFVGTNVEDLLDER